MYSDTRKVYEYSSNVRGFLDSILVYHKLKIHYFGFWEFQTQYRHYYTTREYYFIKMAFDHENSIRILTPVLLLPLFQTTVNHEQRYCHGCISTSNNAVNTCETTSTATMSATSSKSTRYVSILNNGSVCILNT